MSFLNNDIFNYGHLIIGIVIIVVVFIYEVILLFLKHNVNYNHDVTFLYCWRGKDADILAKMSITFICYE
jgi:hypothetical protein